MKELAKLSASIMYDYKVVNTTEHHTWVADEPLEEQGQDEGPTPIELLLSSVAGCVLITLRKYAQRRNWDAGEIHIDLTLATTDEVTLITKDIQFTGNLEQDQKERLLEISGRSPVVKMLSGGIQFKLLE
jgi:putative redox protein